MGAEVVGGAGPGGGPDGGGGGEAGKRVGGTDGVGNRVAPGDTGLVQAGAEIGAKPVLATQPMGSPGDVDQQPVRRTKPDQRAVAP